ncbi:MAG: CHAD domain-containing protein [Planctomycetales bacterium]|nr:CHAD domain-containing protein [Planctomycetales bacterium]
MSVGNTRGIPGLTPEMPIASAVEVVVRARLTAVLERLDQRLHGGDHIDGVHQLRVTSRRSVAALEVFNGWLPKPERRKLVKHLERLRRRSGKARDADVQTRFLDELVEQPNHDAEELAGLNWLRQRSSRRSRKARKKLRRQLPWLANRIRQSSDKLIDSLVENSPVAPRQDSRVSLGTPLILGVDCRETFGIPVAERQGYKSSHTQTLLADVARDILAAELTSIRHDAVWDQAAPDKLHRLRIACKRLRYALEIFLPVLPTDWHAEAFPRIQRLQELLGVIQDGIVGSRQFAREESRCRRRLARRRAETPDGANGSAPQVPRAFSLVQAEYASRVRQAHAEFLDLWRHFCEVLPAL